MINEVVTQLVITKIKALVMDREAKQVAAEAAEREFDDKLDALFDVVLEAVRASPEMADRSPEEVVEEAERLFDEMREEGTEQGYDEVPRFSGICYEEESRLRLAAFRTEIRRHALPGA